VLASRLENPCVSRQGTHLLLPVPLLAGLECRLVNLAQAFMHQIILEAVTIVMRMWYTPTLILIILSPILCCHFHRHAEQRR
jgi:hypothetical protein